MIDSNALAFRVEQVCLNALPALRQVIFDGWLLRFADGHTRRANSVNPLYPGRRPLGAKIAACEALYRRQGLPPIFRIPGIADPALAEALADLGYQAEDETCVRYMALKPGHGAADPAVELAPAPGPEWLAGQARLGRQSAHDRLTYRRMLAAIAVPAAFAAVRSDGKMIALACAALHDGIVCFNAVVTDPKHRRRGHSQRLMARLSAWAEAEGATGACLQVVADNHPALALYDRIGFRDELYRYHYRRQPD